MESGCHKCQELLNTSQLQNEHIRRLTEYNGQCLDNIQKQNKQIELLSGQLTTAHDKNQVLIQRIQQHQSREGDRDQQAIVVNGHAHEASDSDSRITELEELFRDAKAKLEESERQRKLGDEQLETSRRSFESEIAWLKLQLRTYEQDFTSEKRAREATALTLEQVRGELATAQRQLHQNSLQQMQDLYERRQAALEHHRQEYERTHHSLPQYQQQPRHQRPIYQTDHSPQLALEADDVGEDEID